MSYICAKLASTAGNSDANATYSWHAAKNNTSLIFSAKMRSHGMSPGISNFPSDSRTNLKRSSPDVREASRTPRTSPLSALVSLIYSKKPRLS